MFLKECGNFAQKICSTAAERDPQFVHLILRGRPVSPPNPPEHRTVSVGPRIATPGPRSWSAGGPAGRAL